eukprot:Tbor_TRINITY_DN5299_c0_g1::TRINITY_DN5299_c0_g1_i1::g.16473::m.16473
MDDYHILVNSNSPNSVRSPSNCCCEGNTRDKLIINEIICENSTLKAQLSRTRLELSECRDIYFREAEKWRALVNNCKRHSPLVQKNKAMEICNRKSTSANSAFPKIGPIENYGNKSQMNEIDCKVTTIGNISESYNGLPNQSKEGCNNISVGVTPNDTDISSSLLNDSRVYSYGNYNHPEEVKYYSDACKVPDEETLSKMDRSVYHTNNTYMTNFSEIERLFVAFGQDFTSENVGKILKSHENETTNKYQALLKASDTCGKEGMEYSLQSARAELMCAHATIEELKFSLQLERKEKQNLRDQLQVKGDKNTSAASKLGERQELASLHDTLNASRTENTHLQEKLATTEWERQKAVESFTAVKHRSGEILKGCQEITQATSMDANATVTKLLKQLHRKSHDIDIMRNTLLDSQNQLELMKKSNAVLTREAKESKSRLVVVNSNAQQLLKEYNDVSAALRAAWKQAGGQYRYTKNEKTGDSIPSLFLSSRGSPNNVGDNINELERIALGNYGDFPQNDNALSSSHKTPIGSVRSPIMKCSSPTVCQTNRSISNLIQRSSPSLQSSLCVNKGQCEASMYDSRREQDGGVLPAQDTTDLWEYTDALFAAIDDLHTKVDNLEYELCAKSPMFLMKDIGLALRKTKCAEAKLERILSRSSSIRGSSLPYCLNDVKRLRSTSDHKYSPKKQKHFSSLAVQLEDLQDELLNTKAVLEARESELNEGRELLMSLISE